MPPLPLTRRRWAPGKVGDWEKGATGWILWVSLAVMLGDSLTSLAILLVAQAVGKRQRQRAAGVREMELSTSTSPDRGAAGGAAGTEAVTDGPLLAQAQVRPPAYR